MAWNNQNDGEQLIISERLDETQRRELQQLLQGFAGVLQGEPGRTSLTEHRIKINGARTIRQPPYRLRHAYYELVRKELEEMQEKGVIEPSNSEWASPIILVRKKDGSMRFCVGI